MLRLRTMLALGLVLCIIDARDLQAGCCMLWTEYGWSACSSGVNSEDDCIDIQAAGDWKHSYFNAGCNCFGQWPYYVEWKESIHRNVLYRYVIIVDTTQRHPGEPETWPEFYERHYLGMGYNYPDHL